MEVRDMTLKELVTFMDNQADGEEFIIHVELGKEADPDEETG